MSNPCSVITVWLLGFSLQTVFLASRGNLHTVILQKKKIHIYLGGCFGFSYFLRHPPVNQSRVPWFKTLGLNKYAAYSQKPWAYRPGFSAHEPPSHTTTKDVIFNVDHCGEERNRLFIIGSEELVKLVSLKAACSLKLLENLCTADEENAACTQLLTLIWH